MAPGTMIAPLLLSSLLAPTPSQGAATDWNAQRAEHLLNRAGFGARPAEIHGAVQMGHEAFVEHLLTGGVSRDAYFAANYIDRTVAPQVAGDVPLDEKARRELRRRKRAQDEEQVVDFNTWWIERMLSGDDPLREKMTLFWHGHFASSQRVVRNSYEMVRQNELFYRHALGRFADLAHGIVRDPAMLGFLDNDDNRKGEPNENLARELMELFTLGEGNYTEEDVKEAARALTGWTDADGRFKVVKRRHDEGSKTVLGRTGRFDGDGLVEILLDQPACGRFLARKLIAWFEGVEPDAERAAFYGDFFAANDYDLTVFLRRLFRDPAFYRDEVLGNRISSPLEQMVGSARRLGMRPPARLILASASVLGQRPLFPPSVKGWDEGEAWITTSSLMTRGNLAGVLLGVVEIDEILEAAPPAAQRSRSEIAMSDPGQTDPATDEQPSMEASDAPAEVPKRKLGDLQTLKNARGLRWRPRIFLTDRLDRAGLYTDGAIVRGLADELLAIPLPEETRIYLIDELATRRKAQGVKNGQLLADPQVGEPILRDLAHLILSLPEAQLL